MVQAAFVSGTSVLPFNSLSKSATCSKLRSPRVRIASRQTARMSEEPLTAAEKTRRALSETKPLVKFRRDANYLDERTASAYTNGAGKGIDIWIVTGILTFLVPIVGLAVGVATGTIDVNPR